MTEYLKALPFFLCLLLYELYYVRRSMVNAGEPIWEIGSEDGLFHLRFTKGPSFWKDSIRFHLVYWISIRDDL